MDDQYESELLFLSVVHATPRLDDGALAGADVATVPMSVIKAMMSHPLTDTGLKKFVEDYKKAFGG